MTRDEWDRRFSESFCEPTDDLLERPLKKALSDCLAAATDFPDSPFARTCLALNAALSPSEHSPTGEIFASPGATSSLSATLNQPSLIR